MVSPHFFKAAPTAHRQQLSKVKLTFLQCFAGYLLPLPFFAIMTSLQIFFNVHPSSSWIIVISYIFEKKCARVYAYSLP